MDAAFDRYLRLLGVTTEVRGLSGLRLLVRRHLASIPFENLSKLLTYERAGGGAVTTFDEYLDRIESGELGGTCYTNNPFFAELLRELGYRTDLLGADMTKPNVHTCLRVWVDDAPYLVDVGFAAPFRDPLPLAAFPAEVREGKNRYVFEPGSGGHLFRMNLFAGDQYVMCYLAHEPPRSRSFFDDVVMNSYSPASVFLKSLRISRVYDDCSIDLIDRKLYEHKDGHTTLTELRDMEDLRSVVSGPLKMPRCPLEPALAVLERISGAPLFR